MKKAGRRRRVATGIAVSIGASAAIGSAAQAADLAVTTTADSGTGSLREAIQTANATPATKDRILFQSALSGTITLTSDLPAFLGPTEIVGPGMDQLKIDGDEQYRIFDSGANLWVSGLGLSNGRSGGGGGGINMTSGDLVVEKTRITAGQASGGGGIAVFGGSLTLADSEVTGNTANVGGGVAIKNATVAISDSTISGNKVPESMANAQGGGVYLDLPVGSSSTIERSVISGNLAPNAGGLMVQNGSLSIDSTLISGNKATSAVGGAVLGSPFGPPPSVATRFTVTNTTVTGNEAAAVGAIMAASSGVSIESSTVTGNRSTGMSGSLPMPDAAIVGFSPGIGLNNSIVSGNQPQDLSTLPAMSEPTVVPAGSFEGSFNLIGDRGSANFAETVAGSNITSADPGLGPLAENGGPTMTMLPAETSPVVNKGASSLTTDARGLPRPVDFRGIPFSAAAGANGADIGAVELGFTPPPAPANAFSFGWVKLNKKKGVASLQVQVPGRGSVQVLGSKTVAKFSKAARKAGIVTVTIKPKGKATKQLKKKGRAKVVAKVRFTPTGGTARIKSKAVTLVKKKAKKRR